MVTTLIIPEPASERDNEAPKPLSFYLRFLSLFALSVAALIGVYFFSKDWSKAQKAALATTLDNRALAGLLIESLRLCLAITAAGLTAFLTLKVGLANQEMVDDTYIAPVKDFFQRYGLGLAWLLLAIIGLYRISDIVLGVMSNVFYQDIGFSKTEIASAVKSFGLFMTIGGGFLGGVLAMRWGVMRVLILGGILAACTNLLFMGLATIGYNLPALYVVVGIDNLCAGLASAAFVAFLSSLTNVSFTAMQYAIFSSLMTLIPKVFGGYSGGIVDLVGYQSFFILTTVLGIPVILLLLWAQKRVQLELPPPQS